MSSKIIQQNQQDFKELIEYGCPAKAALPARGELSSAAWRAAPNEFAACHPKRAQARCRTINLLPSGRFVSLAFAGGCRAPQKYDAPPEWHIYLTGKGIAVILIYRTFGTLEPDRGPSTK